MATLDPIKHPVLWASREPFQNGWYRYAIRWLRNGDIVMDYGSGTGAGAAIIRDHMKGVEVIEVDSDERLWKHNVKSPEVLHAVQPDWILCIDMIEHVTRQEQEELVALFKRRARKGVFITTPDREQWPNNHNQFHINELSRSELEALMGEGCEKSSTNDCGGSEGEIQEGWFDGAKHLGILWRKP